MSKLEDIYDLAAEYFINGIAKDYDESVRVALIENLVHGTDSEIYELLGEDAFLDYKLFEEKMSRGDYLHFVKELDMLSESNRRMRRKTKIAIIEKIVSENRKDPRLNGKVGVLFIAEKLRKKYFPNSPLEGPLIANGLLDDFSEEEI